MPVMDGLTLLSRLPEANPMLKAVVVSDTINGIGLLIIGLLVFGSWNHLLFHDYWVILQFLLKNLY